MAEISVHPEGGHVPPEVLSLDDLMEKARVELNETGEARRQGLDFLRQEIANDGHLFEFPEINDDRFLLAFLRVSKFRHDRALKRLKKFAEFRRDHADWFTGTIDTVRPFIETGMTGILPFRTAEGVTVSTLFPGRQDRVRFSFLDQMRASVFVTLRILTSVETQICGLALVEDLTGMKLLDTPPMSECKQSFAWMQECLPLRFKGFHVVNAPWYLNALWAVVRPFMSKKMQSRFAVHKGDLSTLHAVIPARILSSEFGGDLGPFDATVYLRDLAAASPEPKEPSKRAEGD